MTLALDTDVLVNWLMDGAPSHAASSRLVRREVEELGGTLGLVPQVIHEFLHVCTDPRRFERPMPMKRALELVGDLWAAPEVVRIVPGPEMLPRTLELMRNLRLGRKRILDTALAATIEIAGVRRLATLNPRDYKLFPFIETVVP